MTKKKQNLDLSELAAKQRRIVALHGYQTIEVTRVESCLSKA
jgi:hypothetical protein